MRPLCFSVGGFNQFNRFKNRLNLRSAWLVWTRWMCPLIRAPSSGRVWHTSGCRPKIALLDSSHHFKCQMCQTDFCQDAACGRKTNAQKPGTLTLLMFFIHQITIRAPLQWRIPKKPRRQLRDHLWRWRFSLCRWHCFVVDLQNLDAQIR